MLKETNQTSARKYALWVIMGVLCVGIGLILASQFVFSKEENKNIDPIANADIKQGKAPLDVNDFDDWRVVCAKGGGQCQMFQRISAQKGNQVLLTATVTYIKNKGKETPVLRFIVPMGAQLTAGLGFRIDDQKAKNVPFQVCGPGGCITELAFDNTLVENLKKSKNMIITFKPIGQKPVSIAVSLKGFSQAFDALKPKAKQK